MISLNRPGSRALRFVAGALLAGTGVWCEPARVIAAAPHVQEITVEAPLDREGSEYHLIFMINELRAAHGIAPLEVDSALIELARERSGDMVQRNYFSHHIPGEGFAPEWVLRQVPRALGAGENLGLSDEPNSRVLRALFQSWVDSPTHLENMLRPEFNRVGVGVLEAPGRHPRASIKVITQVFAIGAGPLERI